MTQIAVSINHYARGSVNVANNVAMVQRVMQPLPDIFVRFFTTIMHNRTFLSDNERKSFEEF